MTNFEKITQSPKELAEFIDKVTIKCMVGKCKECVLYDTCSEENSVKSFEQFLNLEVEE
jgi:hypothetical protein